MNNIQDTPKSTPKKWSIAQFGTLFFRRIRSLAAARNLPAKVAGVFGVK
jgi:hypothetical protein